jgi:hypothetical protein
MRLWIKSQKQLLTLVTSKKVGWVERSETQHLRTFVGLRCRLTQPTTFLNLVE